MEKERVCATDETHPVEPVSDWDNNDTKGYALVSENLFRQNMGKIHALRERQAAYRNSLPTDPPAVISAALKLMHPNGSQYPDGVEEALHLSFALEALVKEGDLDSQGRSRDAALYVADRISHAMHRAAHQLDRISDILGNPRRIERDR